MHWYCWLGVMKSIWPVKKLSDEVLAWLSVWSEVQVICISSSWCHCHSIISCFIKIQIGLTFLCQFMQVFLKKWPLNGCLCLQCLMPWKMQYYTELLVVPIQGFLPATSVFHLEKSVHVCLSLCSDNDFWYLACEFFLTVSRPRKHSLRMTSSVDVTGKVTGEKSRDCVVSVECRSDWRLHLTKKK